MFTPKLDKQTWDKIRKRYESGDESVTKIAKDYPQVDMTTICKRAQRHNWRNPRKLALAAQKAVKTRKARLNDSELARLMNRVLDARKSSSLIARKLLLQAHKDIKNGDLRLKNVKEIHEALDLLERAAGVDREKEGQNQPSIIAYNATFLSGQGPQPRRLSPEERAAVEAEIVDVNDQHSPKSEEERAAKKAV